LSITVTFIKFTETKLIKKKSRLSAVEVIKQGLFMGKYCTTQNMASSLTFEFSEKEIEAFARI
jgi:hypothetical protein